MASNPDFILVPGAWHGPESFLSTTSLLAEAGYKIHGISLPSVGASSPLLSFIPDVEAIRSTLNRVLSSGKDVILVFHSYGSSPGWEAGSYLNSRQNNKGAVSALETAPKLPALAKILPNYSAHSLDSEALAPYLQDLESGMKEGWGRVRRLVFCCSFILPEGGSLMAALGFKPLPWFQIEANEVHPNTPEEIFYNDLTPAQAAPYISALKPHSYLTFSSTLSVAPWKSIPSTYIVCEKDMAIPLVAQEGMLAMAEHAQPGCFDVVERCDAGHSPFISRPEWLAEKLIKAATSFQS